MPGEKPELMANTAQNKTARESLPDGFTADLHPEVA